MPCLHSQAKASCNVSIKKECRFRDDDDLVNLSTYKVKWDMTQTPVRGHDITWQHNDWIRNCDPVVSERSAVRRAKKWARGVQNKICSFVATASGRPRECLSDAGSGNDLVCKDDIDSSLRDLIVPAGRVVELITANGLMTVTEKALLQVEPLGCVIEPLVLESCPPVLTVGKRCVEEGWGFYWPPYTPPYYVKPDGKKVKHIVKRNFPYVIDYTAEGPVTALPANNQSAPKQAGNVSAVPPTSQVPAPAPEVVDEIEVVVDEKIEDRGIEVELGLRAQAHSLKHLLTHMPNNPYCASCMRAKMQAKPARSN